MTAVDSPPLKPGDTLAHYRIEQMIGEGAMGRVYRAHDSSLDRTVGLKVLKPDVAEDERFVHRFVREARAAARVSHPNLAHIYFIGEQDGLRFFVMEFVHGRDLQARVEEEGPLPLEEALDILVQVANGLDAAHRTGVVHRDVKPSNILLQPDGAARVTDFGLAKSPDTDLHVTQADTILGTPTFMSPEQCRSEPVDPRTDVYALGLTAYFLLMGRLPFDATSLGALINDQINKPLPSVTASDPELPDQLDGILQRMCAKGLEDRPKDMQEVIDALEGCRPRPVHPAPLVARGVAAAIDLLPAAGLIAVFELLLQRLFGVGRFAEMWWGHLLTLALFAGYHIGCEARWGATLGKWLLQVEVVTARGTRERARVILPRFALRYPLVVVEVFNVAGVIPVLAWLGYGLQLSVIVASFATYAIARQRSVSDLLTRTRVAVRLDPSTADGGLLRRRTGLVRRST